MLSMGHSLQKTKLKYSNDIKALDGAAELMWLHLDLLMVLNPIKSNTEMTVCITNVLTKITLSYWMRTKLTLLD